MVSMFIDLIKGHMPGQLVVQMTDKCNATCPQCGMRVHEPFDRTSIPVLEMERIIDRAADQGFSALSFTGGEPFLDKEKLLHLIHYAGDANIPYIRTGTNGFLFRNSDRPDFTDKIKSLADELAGSPLRNFWISIDSCDPAVHERMRGLSGVIQGIEKVLPIFHERRLYPSANLGINRNLGGISTSSLKPQNFFSYEDYLDAFSKAYRKAFERFYSFVINLGFTMVNACYPMSMPENPENGLNAVYSASADNDVVRFTSDEKQRLFSALFETIPLFRSKIRIFSPLCSLYSLIAQHGNDPDNGTTPTPCRGGRDFFYVRCQDALTFPCGFRGDENLGPASAFDLSLQRQTSRNSSPCLKCDWECFRDPSELLGPFTEILKPQRLIKRIFHDPVWLKIWLKDLSYYKACNYFDGKQAPNWNRLARFEAHEKGETKDKNINKCLRRPGFKNPDKQVAS